MLKSSPNSGIHGIHILPKLIDFLLSQAEHNKNLAIHNMKVCNDKWRNLYQQQAYIESESIHLMHSSAGSSSSKVLHVFFKRS